MSGGHTPGPWNYGVIRDVLEFQPEWEDASDDRLDADAALIAAAPDLARALADLLADAVEMGLDDSPVSGSLVAAREALRKATAHD
jgi:hypothetical protein